MDDTAVLIWGIVTFSTAALVALYRVGCWVKYRRMEKINDRACVDGLVCGPKPAPSCPPRPNPRSCVHYKCPSWVQCTTAVNHPGWRGTNKEMAVLARSRAACGADPADAKQP